MYLTLNSVNKRFDGANNRGRHQKETLKDISFEAAQGEFLCIVGPSGCGKSTLLNLVAGLVRPTSGEIVLDGKKITGPGAERAVMFQEAALYPWLNVIENIIFGLQATGCPKARQKEIAERTALELPGIPYPSNLRRHEAARRPSQGPRNGQQAFADGRAILRVGQTDDPYPAG